MHGGPQPQSLSFRPRARRARAEKSRCESNSEIPRLVALARDDNQARHAREAGRGRRHGAGGGCRAGGGRRPGVGRVRGRAGGTRRDAGGHQYRDHRPRGRGGRSDGPRVHGVGLARNGDVRAGPGPLDRGVRRLQDQRPGRPVPRRGGPADGLLPGGRQAGVGGDRRGVRPDGRPAAGAVARGRGAGPPAHPGGPGGRPAVGGHGEGRDPGRPGPEIVRRTADGAARRPAAEARGPSEGPVHRRSPQGDATGPGRHRQGVHRRPDGPADAAARGHRRPRGRRRRRLRLRPPAAVPGRTRPRPALGRGRPGPAVPRRTRPPIHRHPPREPVGGHERSLLPRVRDRGQDVQSHRRPAHGPAGGHAPGQRDGGGVRPGVVGRSGDGDGGAGRPEGAGAGRVARGRGVSAAGVEAEGGRIGPAVGRPAERRRVDRPPVERLCGAGVRPVAPGRGGRGAAR